MKNCEEASEKLTNCTCYNLKRRPCQYEVLYDEALCQVESLQRQVRHLRTEVRRIEDENSVLLQQSEKSNSDPNQEIIQLKAKYEKELQRREESWQKELHKWRKEFQNRDAEIRMLRTRIAELEADSAKSAGSDKAHSELAPSTSPGSLPVDENLQKKHNSLPPSDDFPAERPTKICKSYDQIVDELFGSSPQHDEPEGEDNENRSTGIVTDHDATKKPAEKKTTAPSPTKDKVKPSEQSGSKKGSNSVPSSVPSKTRVLKESSRTSPLVISGTLANGQKTTVHSGIKEKDNNRNVFERMKVSGMQDRKAVPSPSEAKRLEADSAKRTNDLCKEDNPKTTSVKDILKPTSFDSKAKVNINPHKRSVVSSSSKPDQHESQKSSTVEMTKKNSYDRKHEKKRKMPDVSDSPKMKEQNSQKRNKIDATEMESGQEQSAKKTICKTGQELVPDQSQLCVTDKSKPSACRQLLVSGTSRQRNAQSDVSTSPSVDNITALKTKAVKVKSSEASSECSQNSQKVNKKRINLSDSERMKAYMDLATRINSEKRKHKASNREPKTVDKEVSPTMQKGAKTDSSKISADVESGDPAEQCTEPSSSVDLDKCPTETVSTQQQSSGGCYSPSVAPVKEDEYDPFNPSIDVFPISKYTIEKNGSRVSRKWPLLSRNILKFHSNQGPDQDTSEAQNEYIPTRTIKNKASESHAYPEPVAYVPSSCSQPSKTDSSQPEATGQHPPPKVSDQPPVSHSTQPTEQHPPAVSRPHQPVTCQSEQLHDSSTQPRNSNSPTNKPAVLGPKYLGASGTRHQQNAESRKHRSDILPELCSKNASKLVLPQLNLSRIGDNLLSGVREALNTVKALSPNLPTAGDGPPGELVPKESKEMQPPSPVKMPKDPIVLMPSPLKMRPKDNDKHLLHSKIISSIKVDTKYLNKITGNASKSEELKAKQAPKSVSDKSSEKALQSGKLWRKRKRNVVAEPKSILKKSRSNDEFTDGMQFNSSSGHERGTIDKDVHSGSKSMKLGDVVSPGSIPACSIASVISDKTCDDKGQTHSSRVDHLTKSEINTSVDVIQKQISQNSAREGEDRCGSAIKPGPAGSVPGVTDKANHLRPGSRTSRSVSSKASQKSSAPKIQEHQLKLGPEHAQQVPDSQSTVVDDIIGSEKQLANELRTTSCSNLDVSDAVTPLTHASSADEHVCKQHAKESTVKMPTHHEGQRLPAAVDRTVPLCQEMPTKLDGNATAQGSSSQLEHGKINFRSSELFNFDRSNNLTADAFDGTLDVGRKAETENEPQQNSVENARKGPSVMDLESCYSESQANTLSGKVGSSKCTKKSDEWMTSDNSEKQQLCANQEDTVFDSVVMSSEQHNEQSDGDWIGDVSNSSSEASTHSCLAADQTGSFEVLSTPEAAASSPRANDKTNTENNSCGVPMELDKVENHQTNLVKESEMEMDPCPLDKTTDLSLLDIILKQSPEEPLHVDNIMYAVSSERNSKPENQLSSDDHSANSSTKHPKPSSVMAGGTGETCMIGTGHKTSPVMVSNRNNNTSRDDHSDLGASLRTAISSPGSQVMPTDKLKTEIKVEGCYTFVSNSEPNASLSVKTEKNWTPNPEDKGNGSHASHPSRRKPDEDSLSESVIVLSDDDENISNQVDAESSSASSYYSSDEHSSEESQADGVEEMSTSSGDCNDDEDERDAKTSSDGQNDSSFADVYSSGECSGSGNSSSSSSSDPDGGSDTESSDCNSDGDSCVDDDDDDNDGNKDSDEAGNDSVSEESMDDRQSESGVSSNSAASGISNLEFRRCKRTLANADTSMAVNFDSDSNNNNNTDCDKASDLVSGLSASNDPLDSTADVGTGLFLDPGNDSEPSNVPDGEMFKCRPSSRDRVECVVNGVEDCELSADDNLEDGGHGTRMKYQASSRRAESRHSSQRKAPASRKAGHETETPSGARLSSHSIEASCRRSARYEWDRPSGHPSRYTNRSTEERLQTSDRYKPIRHDRPLSKDVRRSPTRQMPDKVSASIYQSGRHR